MFCITGERKTGRRQYILYQGGRQQRYVCVCVCVHVCVCVCVCVGGWVVAPAIMNRRLCKNRASPLPYPCSWTTKALVTQCSGGLCETHTRTHAHTHTHTHTYVCKHAHTYTHTQSHTHMHISKSVHKHTHTHTEAHKHTVVVRAEVVSRDVWKWT